MELSVSSATLTADGWDNVSNTHLIAFNDNTPKGPIFKDAEDTTGEKLLGADYNFDIVDKRIQEKPDWYNGFVSDSPSTNQVCVVSVAR